MKVNLRHAKHVFPERLVYKYEDIRAKAMGVSYYDLEDDPFDQEVEKILNFIDNIGRRLNRLWERIYERDTIKIEYADVFDASETLSKIIVPVLKELKKRQQGAPNVDLSDVPEELHDKEEPSGGQVTDLHFVRWSWILDEIIWAFEQDLIDWESPYHHNSDQLELLFTPLEDMKGYSSVDFNHQKDPSKPKYWVDEEGKKKHYERIVNGRRLFGKYYQSFWD